MADSKHITILSRLAALTGAMSALSTVPAIAADAVPQDDRQEWLGLYHAFCKAERDLNAACEQFDCSVDEVPEEHEAYQAAEAAIIEKPANGLAGVAVKLALWVHNDGEPIGIDETMGDAHCPEMVSAWRDAIRLAGLPEGLGTTSYREAYLGLEGGEPDASA